MPSEIEATKGSDKANSYATVEEADAYWDDIYGGSEWADIDDDDKARLLLMAANYINRWSLKYGKADASQALPFPVVVETDVEDAAPDDGFANAKQATIIQAFYLFKNIDTIEEGRQMSIQGVKHESVGPTSKTITGFNPLKKYDSEVFRLLAPYINLDFKTGRGLTELRRYSVIYGKEVI